MLRASSLARAMHAAAVAACAAHCSGMASATRSRSASTQTSEWSILRSPQQVGDPRISLHHGGEEAVRAVHVRVEAQVILAARDLEAQARQHFAHRDLAEVGVLREELVDDVLVFLTQQ